MSRRAKPCVRRTAAFGIWLTFALSRCWATPSGACSDLATCEAHGGQAAGSSDTTTTHAPRAKGGEAGDSRHAAAGAKAGDRSERDRSGPPEVVGTVAAHIDANEGPETGDGDERFAGDPDGASGTSDRDAPPVNRSDADGSTCAARDSACVPVPPSGWAGPVALWQGAATQAAPSCPRGYSARSGLLHADLQVGSVTCHCHCGTASEQACGPSSVTLFADADSCTQSYATVSIAQAQCIDIDKRACDGVGRNGSLPSLLCPPIGAVFGIHATAPSPTGGSCAPKTSSTIAASRWATTARICSMTGSGDEGAALDDVSTPPTPTAPYRTGLCVYRVGDPPPATCPADYPSGPLLYFSGLSDTRTCSACQCGAPSGGSCEGILRVFAHSGCSGPVDTTAYSAGSGCLVGSLFDSPNSVTTDLTVTDPGECEVEIPPRIEGDLSATGATAVCCQ